LYVFFGYRFLADKQHIAVRLEPEIVVSPFPLSPHLGDMVIGDESKWGMKKGA